MALNPLSYIKESKAELDKVIWPTKIQTIKLTFVVIIITVIVGAYITGLDAIMAKIAETLIK